MSNFRTVLICFRYILIIKTAGKICFEEAELTATDDNGTVSGRLIWTNNGGSFALGKGNGMLHSLQAEGIIEGLSNSAYILEGTYLVGQNRTSLTRIPSDPKAVLWMQAHGNVKHGVVIHFFMTASILALWAAENSSALETVKSRLWN